MHWRLYRRGYHLHARASWRRAHPERRQLQREVSPFDLHLLLAQRVVRSEEDTMSPDDWQALEQIMRRAQEAAEESRDQATEADRGSEWSSPRSSLQAVARVTSREQEHAHAHESSLLAARTQEIGQEAEAALVQMLTGDDVQAHAFQSAQIKALRDELAPPGSSIEELLLAQVIAKARFEALLCRACSDALLMDRLSQPEPAFTPLHQLGLHSCPSHSAHQTKHEAKEQALLVKQAHIAERRYLQGLRELANLRRLDGPMLQISVAKAHLLQGPPPA
jgi:hypothetical protein